MNDNKSHYVAVTGIIHKDGKFLIVKRSNESKNFPGKWQVPGGKMTVEDYKNLPSQNKIFDQWYNVLPKVMIREVKEETNIEVKDINFLTDLVFFRTDGIPTLVVSLYCNYKSGDVKLSSDLTDFAWVSVNELKNYNLIDGIKEEIEAVDTILKNKPLPKNFVTEK